MFGKAFIHKTGSWMDKIYYRFFPFQNDELSLDNANEHNHGTGNIIDLRDMNDKEFLEHAKPDLEKLEKLRIIKFAVYKLRKKIALPLCAVLLPITAYIDYLLLWFQRGSDDGAAGLTFFVAGGIYWWVTQPKREYTRAYKEKILPKLAKVFGEFIYKLDGKIPIETLEGSNILPKHDRYETEDYFQGTYKGIAMEFSEINLKQKRRSKNRTYYVSVFKGLAIVLDMKTKKFLGHTILEKNKSKIAEWFKEKSSKMKRARMADPEFEKFFDAYTNDQVEARYIIDPLMIENLKGLYEEYKGESMSAAWYNSKMFILIASKHNHFEPADIHIPATDKESVLSMKHEIGQILNIVDRLELFDPKAIEEEKAKHSNNNQDMLEASAS